MYELLGTIHLTDLIWQSDWGGDEVGFDDVEIVGLYMQVHDDYSLFFYIDMDTNQILEIYADVEM